MIEKYLQQLVLPKPNSHKAQNGKTLIIGGSDLFHAASQWSFRTASRLVDMTFYSSVAENNKLLRDAKFYGTDGVVVARAELPRYLDEVNSILIGPGLRRDTPSRFLDEELAELPIEDLEEQDWEQDTRAVVAVLLKHWPNKRWVIDAGALQVLESVWIPREALFTPHKGEFTGILERWGEDPSAESKRKGSSTVRLRELAQRITDQWSRLETGLDELGEIYSQGEESFAPLLLERNILEKHISSSQLADLQELSHCTGNSAWLVKGRADLLFSSGSVVVVAGGNAGLTKGGTGDVLAGLLVGLVANSAPWPSVVVSSYLNKLAGHELFQERKTMYNASDLSDRLPLVWGRV